MAASLQVLSGISYSGDGLQNMDERSLVSDAKRGRKAALDLLCEYSAPKVLRVLYRVTRNREDAEDALQDSFLRALIHLKDFDGRSRFCTWLTRIAINSALMARRKNRKEREVSMDDLDAGGKDWLFSQISDHSPNPEQVYAQREEGRILNRAIRSLRPRIRAAVQLSHLQELSMKDTAKSLGISVAAAKGRLFHARTALRRSRRVRAIGHRPSARPSSARLTRFSMHKLE
jgi:RNA polymerase sigma factor (sigma-70 family)